MSNLSTNDFLDATLKLLPTGRLWNKSPDSQMTRILWSFMPMLERVSTRGRGLIKDAFPPTTLELLPDWEASLGLPDKCLPTNASIDLRRQQVVTRFVELGGQSPEHIEEYARLFGYEVWIREYSQMKAGMRAGNRAWGSFAPNYWTVMAQPTNVRYFKAGVGSIGERLRTWSNDMLECEIKAIAPAHTVVNFVYSTEARPHPGIPVGFMAYTGPET